MLSISEAARSHLLTFRIQGKRVKCPKRIGIIDILTGEASPTGSNWIYHLLFRKQFYGVMPQVIAAWCRRRGHKVFYATYYGQTDPETLVPDDLDIIFVAAFTEASALSYVLSKIFRARGIRTVLGGPHARSFPDHARHFFDLVVTDCDEAVVDDILSDSYAPGSIISSENRQFDLPSLAERRVDIESASLLFGRSSKFSLIPLLSSTGCPYDCNFCVDWNNPYRLRDPQALAADLQYASVEFPGRTLAFYDPNFGVNFEKTMKAIETVPADKCNPYIIESSLSILKPHRLPRLKNTNCAFVAPAVESWDDYGRKAGTGKSTAWEKYRKVVDHFELISEFVPGIQANFLFGGDADCGLTPIELTVAFIRRFANVFPAISYPIAFGNTPLRSQLRSQARLLPLPPVYYFHPLPTLRFKHYSACELFDGLAQMFSSALSSHMVRRRISTRGQAFFIKVANVLRTLDLAPCIKILRRYQSLFVTDSAIRNFYDGISDTVPAYYDTLLDSRLGRYASLLTKTERHLVSQD